VADEDVFTEWKEVGKHWPGGKVDVLSSWTMQNVEERNHKLELKEIERFPNEDRCPLDVLVKALNEPDAKKATGPPPAPHTKRERVTRQLKKARYPKITLGVVERVHALLQKHRPEWFPRPPASTPPSTSRREDRAVQEAQRPT